ncbi:MAG: DNA repair protein RecO [Patescibacteria group bacterium]
MKQLLTRGIILSRTDYGEADRIITVLTPEQGKLSLMARGVRKPKSRLAGGIELFSTTEITYMNGRGAIGTLVSARLIKYYSSIVKDIDRVQLGYELIKKLHRATEDQPEEDYYDLLEAGFAALDTPSIRVELIRIWFEAQLLRYAGHSPNLKTDTEGRKLDASLVYNFDFDEMAFADHKAGQFGADQIKFLRLVFSGNLPKVLSQVEGHESLAQNCQPLVGAMLQTHIRI